MSDELIITHAEHVRTLRLNRPATRNALSAELAWGIVRAIEQAKSDDACRLVVITGTGDAFCSGLDLKQPGGVGDPQSAQTSQLDDIGWVGRFLLTLRQSCDKPVIAAINGVAVGAGLSLAMAADIRIMARGARLMAGYPRIGGSPDGGLTFTLPQAIGYERALRFLLENRTVNGPEALELGLVSEIVDDSELPERIAEYAGTVAGLSPITLRLTKRGIARATASIDLEAQVRFELNNIKTAFASQDGREARRAFLEKRPPVFRGR
ncbi:MAG: enoyl-CoA hydratase/isomerase family protein [Proteobacteria bacterium]|nr:enoyl-CoA hydratase/isomerase family protein [Pseudomonadota bacterium]